MKCVFADTFFFLAILNAKDAAHEKAMAFSASRKDALLTTVWVLTELADALCNSSRRHAFQRVVNNFKSDPQSVIVPPSLSLFEQGMELYNARSDKDWSLTDCVSFVVMNQHGIREALTGDRHFEQAGFRALLA